MNKILSIALCVITLGIAVLLIIQRNHVRRKSPIEQAQDSLIHYTQLTQTFQDSSKYYAEQAEKYKQKRDSVAFLVYLNSHDLDPYRDSLRTAIRRKIEAKARSNTVN